MTPRLTLGYRTAVADHDHLLGAAGRRVTGHEFHRTTVTPPAGHRPGWLLDGVPDGFSLDPAGTGTPTLHASYLHTHWAGHPSPRRPLRRRRPRVRQPCITARLLEQQHELSTLPAQKRWQVRAWTTSTRTWTTTGTRRGRGAGRSRRQRTDAGPAGVAGRGDPGQRGRPGRLSRSGRRGSGRDRRRARRPADRVLPSAGGAELFTLLARARRWRQPVVVHPQFTEPEAALRAAGYHAATGDADRTSTASASTRRGSPPTPTW